mgnify:CR=1 FL=1
MYHNKNTLTSLISRFFDKQKEKLLFFSENVSVLGYKIRTTLFDRNIIIPRYLWDKVLTHLKRRYWKRLYWSKFI